MKKLLLLLGILSCWAIAVQATIPTSGYCQKGGITGQVSGLSNLAVVPKVQGSYPQCTITVFIYGTSTPATIYSDNTVPTPMANPFTADTAGQWTFFANNGQYTVQASGTGFASPVVLGTVQLTDPLSTGFNLKNSNAIRYADQYAGVDWCAKVTAAQSDLPSTGGVVDARGLNGTQACASGMTIGSSSKPITIIMGTTTLSISAIITVSQMSAIQGLPAGLTNCTVLPPSIIKAANSTNLATMINLAGVGAALKELGIDANKSNNSGAGNAILASARFVDINHLSIINAKGKGVYVTASSNNAAAGHIRSSFVCGADGNGMEIFQTGDWFVEDTQFENNEGIGLNLDCAPAPRVHGGDVGGNGHNSGGAVKPGMRIQCKSGPGFSGIGAIVVGTQFGNNWGNQIEIDGWDPILANYNAYGQSLSGIYVTAPQGSTNTVDGIHVTDGFLNKMDAYIWSGDAAHTQRYGIAYTETAGGRAQGDVFSGFLTGTFGTAPSLSVANSPFFNCVNDRNTLAGYCRQGPRTVYGNTDYLYWADSGGSPQPILGVNADNTTSFVSAGGDLRLQSSPGAIPAIVNATGFSVQTGFRLTTGLASPIVIQQNTLTLANGANNDVALGGAAFTRIVGPSGAFNITGFAAGINGRLLYLNNPTGQALTIRNNVGSSAGNRILTATGADLVGVIFATFLYDSAGAGFWRVVATTP